MIAGIWAGWAAPQGFSGRELWRSTRRLCGPFLLGWSFWIYATLFIFGAGEMARKWLDMNNWDIYTDLETSWKRI